MGFSDAFSAAWQTLLDLEGVTLELTRGAGDAWQLQAIPADTETEFLSEVADVGEHDRYQDLLIAPADYQVAGQAVLPSRDDRLTGEVAGSQQTFVAVRMPGTNELWRYSDAHGRTWLRVHTLRV